MRASTSDLRRTPELALVFAARARDRVAFAELVRRREAWLRALARRLCGDAQSADDLAQEAFLRAWLALPKLREPSAFGAWLRRLAIHLFIDAQRVECVALDEAADLEALEAADPSPGRVVEAQLDLERAMAQLSASERLCIVLNLGEGLSHGQIAATTGLALGTIKSHILRGTAKIRAARGTDDE